MSHKGQDAKEQGGAHALTRREGGVLFVTLNRPVKKNAISIRMIGEL